MQQNTKKERKRNLASSIIGAIISIILLMITSKAFVGDANAICLWFLAGVYLVLFHYFAFWGYAVKKIKNSSYKRETIVCSIIVTLLLFLFLPFRYDNVLENNYFLKNYLDNQTIAIEPLKEKNELSSGYQIWLEGIKVDGKDYNLYNISLPDKWDFVEDRPFTDNQMAPLLSFKLNAKSSYDIMIRKGPNAGMARVSVGTKSAVVDFYQEMEETRAELDIMEIVLQDGGYPKKISEQVCYNFIFIEIVAEVSAVLSVWLISFLVKEKKLKERDVKGNGRESERDT